MVEEAIIEGEKVEVAVKVDEETGKIVHLKVDSQGNEIAQVDETALGIGQVNAQEEALPD